LYLAVLKAGVKVQVMEKVKLMEEKAKGEIWWEVEGERRRRGRWRWRWRGDGGGGGGGGGDGGGGRGNVEDGGGDRNLRPIDISKLVKMSAMVTVQTTATAVGFRICGQHSLNRVFLVCILFIDLMGYLCCMIAILLIHKNPRVAGILGRIGSIAVAFGFIVLTAMFLVGSLV
jgi:hypothetical protein